MPVFHKELTAWSQLLFVLKGREHRRRISLVILNERIQFLEIMIVEFGILVRLAFCAVSRRYSAMAKS